MSKESEYRKKEIKKMTPIGKCAVYLGLYRIWYIFEELENGTFKRIKYERVNPYNPLTWLIVIPILIINEIYDALKRLVKDMFDNMDGLFTITKSHSNHKSL